MCASIKLLIACKFLCFLGSGLVIKHLFQARLVEKSTMSLGTVASSAVLRLRGSICHMRGFIFTNARKIYYHLRV